MKKKGMLWNQILGVIMMVGLLMVLSGILFPALGKGLNSLFSCWDRGGECMSEAEGAGREPVGGYFKDCNDKAKQLKVERMGCFWRQELISGGIGLANEPPTEPGVNIRMMTLAGSYEGGLPYVRDSPESAQVIDKQSLKVGEVPVKLFTRRLYGFYAIWSGPEYKFCSVYIRDGSFVAGDNSNILRGLEGISTGKCDDLAKSMRPLYYVPKDGDANLQLVVLAKKKPDDHYAQSKVFTIPLNIITTKEPKYDTFKGYPETKVDNLLNIRDYDKPVSFSLENRYVVVKFNNVLVTPGGNMNFDDAIVAEEGLVKIDGTKLDFLQPGRLVEITMKESKWKAPAKLGYFKWTSPMNPDEMKSYKLCDPQAGSFCKDVNFAQTGTVTFRADIAGSYFRYKVFPGNCGMLKNSKDCLEIPWPLIDATLGCTWDNNLCVQCRAQSNPVQTCGDYSDKAFCFKDTCNVENDGDPEKSACTWAKKTLWRDGCISCKGKTVKDYKSKEICEANSCKLAGRLLWSDAIKKCLDCEQIGSCTDYDKISKDQAFCELEDVCGMGCEKKDKVCVVKTS